MDERNVVKIADFGLSHKMFLQVQREFLKTRFSRCMLYRHNAAIGTDWNLFFLDNSLYLSIYLYIYYPYIFRLEPTDEAGFQHPEMLLTKVTQVQGHAHAKLIKLNIYKYYMYRNIYFFLSNFVVFRTQASLPSRHLLWTAGKLLSAKVSGGWGYKCNIFAISLIWCIYNLKKSSVAIGAYNSQHGQWTT